MEIPGIVATAIGRGGIRLVQLAVGAATYSCGGGDCSVGSSFRAYNCGVASRLLSSGGGMGTGTCLCIGKRGLVSVANRTGNGRLTSISEFARRSFSIRASLGSNVLACSVLGSLVLGVGTGGDCRLERTLSFSNCCFCARNCDCSSGGATLGGTRGTTRIVSQRVPSVLRFDGDSCSYPVA